MKNKGDAKFGGQTKCIMEDVQMVNLQKSAYSRRICTLEFVIVFKLQNNNVCALNESTLCIIIPKSVIVCRLDWLGIFVFYWEKRIFG